MTTAVEQTVRYNSALIREKRVQISALDLFGYNDGERVDFLVVELHWTNPDTGRPHIKSVRIPAYQLEDHNGFSIKRSRKDVL